MAFTPLNALSSFLAVARRRSFAAAARDLGVWSIVFDDDTGRTGMLIYGFTPNWGATPHYMVGRRVVIGHSE